MQASVSAPAQRVPTGPVSQKAGIDGNFLRSEKTKDIRSTNITAARGLFFLFFLEIFIF